MTKIRKFLTTLPTILFVVLIFTGTALDAASHPFAGDNRTPPLMIKDSDPLPQISAMSAIVMEATTGQIIYARDIDKQRPPASTTKMMTLITALKHGNLHDTVRISKHAAGTEGSTLWLDEGDKIRLEELLTGMIMVSGNDGAVAVAEHIGGNIPHFAHMMNEEAEKIGALKTHFTNPSGLPDDKHLTTARDLALMACYGYADEKFAQIVSTKEKSYPWVKDPTHNMRNENQLLWFYDGANGVKTGYTDKAGRCLVSAAKRGNIQLVAVVLDSINMWDDSMLLLDYGFSHIHPTTVIRRGDICGKATVNFGMKKDVPLKSIDEIVLPTTYGTDIFAKKINVPNFIVAPLKKGTLLGEAEIWHDDKKIATAQIVAAEDVERKSFFLMIWDFLKNLFP